MLEFFAAFKVREGPPRLPHGGGPELVRREEEAGHGRAVPRGRGPPEGVE